MAIIGKCKYIKVMSSMIPYFILSLFVILSCSGKDRRSTPITENSYINRFQDVKDELFNKGFQQILRIKGIDVDRWFYNDYEVLHKGNVYVNHYYKLTIDFPDELQIDRGPHEYSIVRASDSYYGISFTLAVIPVTVNLGNNTAPSLTIDEWRNILKSMSGVDPVDLRLESVPVGRYLFKGVNYRLLQYYPSGNTYYMRIVTMNLSMFNNVYSISYSAPDIIFDGELLVQVLNTFQITNPRLSTVR